MVRLARRIRLRKIADGFEFSPRLSAADTIGKTADEDFRLICALPKVLLTLTLGARWAFPQGW